MYLTEKKAVRDKTLSGVDPHHSPPLTIPQSLVKMTKITHNAHNNPVSHETARFFHHKMIEKKKNEFFMILLLFGWKIIFQFICIYRSSKSQKLYPKK